ncbi:hypothetical protein FOCC_FOCC008543 [Frankliniella occidentalis]|uniref:6-phosphofructo-2-kinase/fructose-2, 6-bisphosphatase n=1 Tax=Frankliniella occidentalis TaxID=133901 RepID=A0A6J1TB49_FRAOC|nr:6-phosphofructo-2-kinase/fructose-2,6-bisphosphatase [Frankliniella occidentalis]KAE8744819.1 hypothetical protein FOCC_FOCC008543 [Frankliniella occidentalis]
MALILPESDKKPHLMMEAQQPASGSRRAAAMLVVMVGLPATGKTLLAKKLANYLNWTGQKTKVFRVSDYRRKHVELYSHDLFRCNNSEAAELRKKSAMEAMDDARNYLLQGGQLAILDGTNCDRSTRTQVTDTFTRQHQIRVLFIECVCDDEDLLESNTKEILKHSSDYKEMNLEKAVEDFRLKMEHYLEVYQTMSAKREPQASFIRLVNAGETVTARGLDSPLDARILGCVPLFNPTAKTLYFSRHGESEYNMLGRIGGDADLSPRGRLYAQALARYFTDKARVPGLRVCVSEKKRTQQTASGLPAPYEILPALNELDAGVCEGLTYEEMQEKYPQEFAWRDRDKLRYRYPWGESYVDICRRLEPVLLELERTTNVLVVAHQAVLRCMLGYFLNKDPEELPYLNVPLHTVIKLTLEGFTYRMETMRLNVECVDTYRKQPRNCSDVRTADDALKTVPKHYDTLKFLTSPLIEQH